MTQFYRFLFLLFASFGSSFLFGQVSVKGQLWDKQNNEPVSFAHISVFALPDSNRVDGMLSDVEGKFQFSLAAGNYVLEMSFVGFATTFERINIGSKSVNLGKISMEPSTEGLDEVTVYGAAKLLQSDGEKRTFDVQKTILSEGGTALEVLNTLPSVQVDEEGNLSMRGSGDILIYINGRPTNLSGDDTESILQQFPADAIEKVELITNPSSRYDAQGVGGIINIILKKSQMQGFNGQVNTSIGTRNKYTAGVNANYRKGRFNLNVGYSYQYRQLFMESESFRTNRMGGQSAFLNQDYYTENYDPNHLVRIQLDYDIHNRFTLGVFSTFNARTRTRDRTYNIAHENLNRQPDSSYVRGLNEDQFRTNVEGGVTVNWEGKEEKDQFYGMVCMSYDNRDRTEFFEEQFLTIRMPR
ncbi:MAG: carboxypeptidase-like regulatory domain-containing protein [Cryomorphaceae bacterium]|nr:carboxypeptidase-like regulatory domain-containing protein [Cryomorphaceae bacterium]